MIIRTVEIDTEEHARIFDTYVASLNYVKQITDSRITQRDMAFGIGRPLTDAEWSQYFKDFPNTDKSITADEAKILLKEKLLPSDENRV
jgi:hypothetical protein